jgi:hypothetical protein
MRPFSFTKNVGGFRQAHEAIRRGYAPGVTVKEFRALCGLNDQSLLVANYLLGTQVHDGEEVVLGDSLIEQTLSQPYSRLTARLYFFSVNLNMPGERLDGNADEWAKMQNTFAKDYLFDTDGFLVRRLAKDEMERVVGGYYDFEPGVRRKWVTNYSFMVEQCEFVPTPSGRLETFPDTWGPLALRLFFERFIATEASASASDLISAAHVRELHKLIGTPRDWLDGKLAGAASMFLDDQQFALIGSEEDNRERESAKRGLEPPPPGAAAHRREALIKQIVRRTDNVRFLHTTYGGECQLSGTRLIMPDGSFSVDCAHIKPLGSPHFGKDSIDNMLSLSPNMHRLFDRGCVRIDPEDHSIGLRHGNEAHHFAQLLIRENHTIDRENLSYYLAKILK